MFLNIFQNGGQTLLYVKGQDKVSPLLLDEKIAFAQRKVPSTISVWGESLSAH